jgi:hypothetical protein
MEVLEISTSGAIAKLSFNTETSEVGVYFKYNTDKSYLYGCDDIEGFRGKIHNTFNSGESIGKLISQSKKDGTLKVLDVA